MEFAKFFLAAAVCGLGVSAAQAQVEQVGKSAETIVQKPLKDMNVVKEEIPPELESIMARPYSLAGLSTCAQYSAEIAKLTKVLGPDVDSVQPKQGQSVSEMALGGIESAAAGMVPGSSIIRKVSGAEKQQQKAKAAAYAGSLRRAYLKGTAQAKGCKI